jgi:hypothetical protein
MSKKLSTAHLKKGISCARAGRWRMRADRAAGFRIALDKINQESYDA